MKVKVYSAYIYSLVVCTFIYDLCIYIPLQKLKKEYLGINMLHKACIEAHCKPWDTEPLNKWLNDYNDNQKNDMAEYLDALYQNNPPDEHDLIGEFDNVTSIRSGNKILH